MTDAVIVSTARTPIGKAYRGALNATEGATLLGHAIGEAVARAKVDPKEVEDVVMGAALQQGSTGGNIARKALLRAGLPVTVGGTTIDRQCASGLQAIALAARSVIFDGVEIAVGGGGESISLVQNDHANKFHAVDPELVRRRSVQRLRFGHEVPGISRRQTHPGGDRIGDVRVHRKAGAAAKARAILRCGKRQSPGNISGRRRLGRGDRAGTSNVQRWR